MAPRRKAAPTRKAESERDRRLPAVARRRDRDTEAASRRVPRRDRGSGARRLLLQGDTAAREADPVAARAARDGDGHPSSILRAPDDAAREREMTLFVADLKAVARVIRGLA